MPIPKGSKPWWPDRTVRNNPDDPEDLSGYPVIRPGSEEEGLLNQAGGDDKGLEHPDPHGDSAPGFRWVRPGEYIDDWLERNERRHRNALTWPQQE
jgi:hypothetical protein